MISTKTLSVAYGERFEILEALKSADIHIDSDKWVLAQSLENPHSAGLMRIPLKCVAREGSLESQFWYFGNIDRLDANSILRYRSYPAGTFLIRKWFNS